MKSRHFTALFLVLTLALLYTTKANAFKFPKIPKIPGVGAGLDIPGVDALLKREPALSTSLADTVPEIYYLDDYNPATFSPLVEVPRDSETHFLRYPGLYTFMAQSYCLHAGSYGPRSGNGYLYAPLKGKRAETINNILRNSVSHPELPQRDIQVLIWSVLAETKVSNMPDKMQETANTLLTKKEISKLNGGALGQIPPEVSSQLLPKLPPLARMAFDAENSLRGMLSQQTMPLYADLERVAVLTGDPPAGLSGEKETEEVPSGRWSYHPNGYFLRMFPTSYQLTKVQIYEPETFDIERDNEGRITRIVDPRGNIIETSYADSNPLQVNGDAGLRGWAFSSVRFVNADDPANPGQQREKVWKNVGWTWNGATTAKGSVGAAPAPFTDAAARYQAVQKYDRQMQRLDTNLQRNKYTPASATSTSRLALSNLAYYRAALKNVVATASAEDAWTVAQADMIANVWQSTLHDELETSRNAAIKETSGAQVQLVDFQHVRQLKSFDGELERKYGPGSGFGGGGAGMPGNPGRQRLAQSSRPAKKNKNGGPDSIDRAKRATDALSNASDVVTIATGGFAGFASGYLPGKMFGGILTFILDNGRKITDALDMDPPRDDFTTFAMPPRITVPAAQPSATLSAARAKAWNTVMEAAIDVQTNLRAAHISVDRHGGALQAKDARWVYNQGAAIVHYKKAAGASMIHLANSLDALNKISKAENIPDPRVDSELLRKYAQQLQAQGYSAEEKEAASLVGLTDEELAQIKEDRIAADTSRTAGETFSGVFSNLSTELRAFGTYLNSLPLIDLPTAPESNAKQARAVFSSEF